MYPRRFLALSLALAVCCISGGTAARSLSILDLLDAYAAGGFDPVVEELAGDVNFDEIQARRGYFAS